MTGGGVFSENFLRSRPDVGYNRPMLQTARPKKKSQPKALVHEKYLEAFRWMLLARTFEEKLASMYRGGRITGGVYVGKGQEAVSGACDEGTSNAAVEHVPQVAVANNNHYAYSTPNDREFACANLVDRARGYGFEGYELDGTDLAQCLDVIGTAVKRARAGRPPQLVVASILRLAGHGEHDDFSYVTDDIRKEPFAIDCLQRTEAFIKERELADAATLQRWREEAAEEVENAFSAAQKEPVPNGEEEDWCAISTRDLVDEIE